MSSGAGWPHEARGGLGNGILNKGGFLAIVSFGRAKIETEFRLVRLLAGRCIARSACVVRRALPSSDLCLALEWRQSNGA
jgi:hypothetical protein